MTVHVTVPLDDEQAARLEALASARDATAADVLAEAVNEFLAYETWFAAQVDLGLEEAARGEFIDFEDVQRGLKAHIAATQSE